MKMSRMTRRQFFKASAFGAGALALPAVGLAAVAAAPLHPAQAAIDEPLGPVIPQPTFQPIAADTSFGTVSDIAMGWDGTLRGIDAQGAPHVYDPIANAWQHMGQGLDAAAQLGGQLYFFQGAEFVTVMLSSGTLSAGAPRTIASQWPSLPDTFKLGLNGAANFNDKGLILFNGGRFLSTDTSIPLTSLTSLSNWPTAAQWQDGVIDGVFCSAVGEGIILLRGNEYVVIDPVAKTATSPALLNNPNAPAGFSQSLPSAWQATGFDTGVVFNNTCFVFKSAAGVSYPVGGSQPASAIAYIGTFFDAWPATWHPTLLQAPCGRDGSLWCIATAAGYAAGTGQVLQHNGEVWTASTSTVAASISAGQDGTVVHVNPASGSMWKWNGAGWDMLGNTPAPLHQVSLGSASEMWVRDGNNNVYRFDPAANTFTQSATVGQATHIATTHDGTLWHARANDANAYRLLAGSDVLEPAIPVQQGIVSSVQKVTGTGYGASYCLVQAGASTNVYRYDSPYVFKSQYGYVPIFGSTLVEALGMVYFTNSLDENGDNYPVIAMDAHTGELRSQSANVPNPMTTTGYTPPVFDPVNELIYVGITQPYQTALNNVGPGQIIALDAHDLSKVVWSYNTPGFVNNALTVIGTTLIAGDLTGNVYLFDTTAVLANPAQPTPTAIWSLPVSAGAAPGTDVWSLSKVILVNDLFVMTAWDLTLGFQFLAQFDVTSPTPAGLNLITIYDRGVAAGLTTQFLGALLLTAPPLVQQLSPDGSATLAISAIAQVLLVNMGTGGVLKTFSVPQNAGAHPYVFSELILDTDNNQLWFGDNAGRLFCLNTQFQAVNHTPAFLDAATGDIILSTPVIYRDASGSKTILSGLLESQQSGYLYGFDPDTGNVARLVVGNTQIVALSQGLANGVLYAGGASVIAGNVHNLSQLFGLRVDKLVQAARDFIIESQLMQDPDQTAANHSTDPNDPIPPSVARYQTHLSVVDDQKTPRANEPVKIWADTPGTVITIDGQSFTIGPADAQFAQVKTGPDGTLVIMSDADDINASALRVWAGFMDPYERIVVYPDHEWHGRMVNSTDDPNANIYQPDPSQPNFSTVHNYSGTQLFTDTEKTNKFPGQIASAVAQMKAGVNPGGNNAATLAGSLGTLHASNPSASYIAYTDLGGMHYAASNALVQRTATINAPLGLQFSADDTGTITYTALSHSDARNAVDALEGVPWDPNNPDALVAMQTAQDGSVPEPFAARGGNGITRADGVDSIFGSFWHWIKHSIKNIAAKVEKVVVSVGENITVGITYILKGVRKVFKAVVKVIEDVVNAIGAFFLQFGKFIEDVIEALSLLLHFGEIMKTHRWMRDQVNSTLQSAVDAIQNQVKPALDNVFVQGESSILSLFQSIRQSLNIKDDAQINDLSNARSTAHSIFKAGNGSAGPGSSGSSQAVPSTHAMQKLKSGLPSAQVSLPFASAQIGATVSVLTPAALQSDIDVLGSFVTDFSDSLETNTGLKTAFASLQSAITGLFQPPSAGGFFKSSLNALLTIIEDLIVAAVALTQALADGLIGAIESLINVVSAVLNAPLDIPFFSWLFNWLFDEDLTILNLITLVAAIPVTLLYRVATGRYPSSDGFSGSQATRDPQRAQPEASQSPALTPEALKRIQGLIGAAFGFAIAVTRLVNDTEFPKPTRAGLVCAFAFGACYTFTYFPLITQTSATPLQWVAWGLGGLMTLFGLLGIIPIPGGPTVQAAWKITQISLQMAGCAARFAIYIVLFVKGANFTFNSDLNFARNLFLEVPGLFGWMKLIGDTAAIILATVNFLAGLAVSGIDLMDSWAVSDPEPMPQRWFLPWVGRAA